MCTNSMSKTLYSVTELNKVAKNALERTFAGVMVEGEISDLIQHRSGHWYFTLKDDHAQLRSAMFRSSNQRVAFNPKNGQQVVLTGRLSIYEARGSYQFIAEKMAPAGLGKLQLAFDELKSRLALEGLFETTTKKELPTLPRQVAVITSPQGAAIRDIQSTFARRFAGIELVVIPVAVQGSGAAHQIANAIELANQLANGERTMPASAKNSVRPEAIIIGRGGGSLEDLWSFNEAEVAYAVFNSELPIVSAVGHETDFTIADFVADARAATPTAAAELLSPNSHEMTQKLQAIHARLAREIHARTHQAGMRLNHLTARLKHPGEQVQQQAQGIDHLDMRLSSAMQQRLTLAKTALTRSQLELLHHSPHNRLAAAKTQLNQLHRRLLSSASRQLETQRARSSQLASALHLVSPLATLQRGYAIVKDEKEAVIRSTKPILRGSQISAHLYDGTLTCTVNEVVNKTVEESNKPS